MDKARFRVILVFACALAALGIGIAGIALIGGKAGSQRDNTIALARDYIGQQEYQRALDLLDGLLIKNAGDAEAKGLRDEAVRAKKEYDTGQRQQLSDIEGSQQKSIEQSLNRLGSEIEKTAKALPSTSGTTTAPAQSAAAASSSSSSASSNAAQAAENAAKKKAAEEELARKAKEEQDRARQVQGLLDQGKKELADRNFPDARQTFTQAASLASDPADTLASIGDAFYQGYRQNPDDPASQELLKDAIRNSREAIGKDPELALPHYTLGKINNDLKQWDNAVVELTEASRLDPKNYLVTFELGKAQFGARKYAEARQSFETTTALNPKFEPAYVNLGGTLKALGKNADALKAFQKAIQVKPDYEKAQLEIARLLAANGDNTGAIVAYKKALQLAPTDSAAMRELATAYSVSGDYKTAEGLFEDAVLQREDDLTDYNLAVVKLNLGKGKEAVAYAEKAVRQKPSSAQYQYTLGLAYEAAGNTDGAITAYAQAASLDKNYVGPRVNLGRIYLDEGFVDKALDYCLAAYVIDPKGLEVNNNLGAVYAKKELYDKSIKHYEAALSINPRDVGIHLNLARAYVGNKAFEKAKTEYQDLIKLSPEQWDAYYELGKVFVGLGDQDSAKRTLSDLLKKKPDYSNRPDVEKIIAGL